MLEPTTNPVSSEPAKRMQAPIPMVLIEDDDVDAESIRRAFQGTRLGVEITRFWNGEEALEALRGQGPHAIPRPCLILLDLAMPRMNGLEFLRELRKDPNLSQSVVFVITTSENQQDLQAAYRLHVAGYIVKSNHGPTTEELADMLSEYWRHVE